MKDMPMPQPDLLPAIEVATDNNPRYAVIWLHGLGADGHDFMPIIPELRLAPHAVMRFIFPHAPVRPITLNNGMPMRAWYDIRELSAAGRQDEAGTRASAARLNTMLLKQKLFDAKISFGQGSVALVAFTEQDKVYLRPDVKVARLLIDRGPVLAAQRVTVQAASADFVAATARPSMAERVKTSRSAL